MTIRKTSETEWEREFAAGDRNDFHDIEATAAGLVIGYDVIPWAEIDAARCALLDRGEYEFPFPAFVGENDPNKRSANGIRLLLTDAKNAAE